MVVKSGVLWRKVAHKIYLIIMATFTNSLPIFSGEYRHALDGKNRVTIPSCWRNGEADEFFLIVNPSHGCLTVMPPSVFMSIGEEAKTRCEPSKRQDFIRKLYGKSKQVTADKQGRLLVPEDQGKQAGLQGETVLVGVRDRFEIWSLESWTKFQEAEEANFEEVAKEIGL